MPFDTKGRGSELLIERLGLQRRGERVRTYGTYQVFIDGELNGEPITAVSDEAIV